MDEAAKKKLLRTVPYGLYAATLRFDDGRHHGFLLSWFTQCSFKPPMFACGIHRDARALKHLSSQPGRAFAINVLGSDQKELAGAILKKPAWEDGQVAGEPFEEGDNGCAVLPSSLGALEARVVEVAGTDGDHHVVICEVTEAHHFRDGQPLTHGNTGWKYGG